VGGHLVVGMVGLLLSQNLLRSVSSALDVHLGWHHRGQNTCWPVLVGEHCFTGVLPGFSLPIRMCFGDFCKKYQILMAMDQQKLVVKCRDINLVKQRAVIAMT
jgi:hypothetical protein